MAAHGTSLLLVFYFPFYLAVLSAWLRFVEVKRMLLMSKDASIPVANKINKAIIVISLCYIIV